MDELSNLFGGTEKVWEYIQKYANTAGRAATKTVLELYYVVKSPNTPIIDKTIIIAALGYQLLPEDLIDSQRFGWLGMIDNSAALLLAYDRVKARVTPQIESQANAILNQWFGPEEQESPESSSGKSSWFDEPQRPNNWIPNVQPIHAPTSQPSTKTNSNSNKPFDDDDVVID